ERRVSHNGLYLPPKSLLCYPFARMRRLRPVTESVVPIPTMIHSSSYRTRCTLLSVALFAALTACSTTKHREMADHAAYSRIEQKSPEVPGMTEGFTIDQDLPATNA